MLKKIKYQNVSIVIIFIMLIGGIWFFANPKRLILPNPNDIMSIEMEQFNEESSLGKVDIYDQESIDLIVSALKDAKKTMRYSTNDYPIQSNFLIVRLNLIGERRTLCLYAEQGGYYIEEPYVGIYKSDRSKSVDVYKIYTDNEIQKLRWEYMPARSSIFPALPITFNIPIDEILVTVNRGTLYIHDDTKAPNYINMGQEVIFNNNEKILWSPLENDFFDSSGVSDQCDLQFKIISESGQSLSGRLHITQMMETNPEDTGIWTYLVTLYDHDAKLSLSYSEEYDLGIVCQMTPPKE
jgi:hypothetical protein